MNLFAHILPVLLSLTYLSHASSNENEDEISTSESESDAVKRLNLYKKLFKIKRKDHISAIERIILIDDVSKTAAFVDTMLKTIIKTVQAATDTIKESGFKEGNDLPEKEEDKHAFSQILENTALFTDLVVRFPTPSHYSYERNRKEWKKVMKTAISICENSGVYEGDYRLLLHNIKQELGIGPKDAAYSNPFRDPPPEPELSTEERKELYKEAKRKAKLQKKKSKPKLSKSEL